MLIPAERRPVGPEELVRLKTLQDARLAPDGRSLVYALASFDEAGAEHVALWLLALGTGETRQLSAGRGRDNSPAWSPDGTQIAFRSTRDGKPQLYLIAADGGEARAARQHYGAALTIFERLGDQQQTAVVQARLALAALCGGDHAVASGADLITTADTDDRVVPARAYKFAATLQHADPAGQNVSYLRVEVDAGHGVGKPTSQQIEELADVYVFRFEMLGVS